MLNTQAVTFPAAHGGSRLKCLWHLPEASAPRGYAVVCHLHPQMGGTMDHTLVVAVCRALAARNWAASRFNFRGAFDQGRGGMDDVAGALNFLLAGKEAVPDRIAVIGYSFGAQIGLRHAARDVRVRRLVGIALVQDHYADPFLDNDPHPSCLLWVSKTAGRRPAQCVPMWRDSSRPDPSQAWQGEHPGAFSGQLQLRR